MYRIYFNLTQKLFSIQAKVDGRWKVIDRQVNLTAYGCTPKVYESGRQRILKEGKKYVHAYIECAGYTQADQNYCLDKGTITYNPFKYETFQVRKWDNSSLQYEMSEFIAASKVQFLSCGKYEKPELLIQSF